MKQCDPITYGFYSISCNAVFNVGARDFAKILSYLVSSSVASMTETFRREVFVEPQAVARALRNARFNAEVNLAFYIQGGSWELRLRCLQDLLDELVAATLLQMPRPGAVLVQSLHSGFVHQWQGTSDFCSPAKMLRRLLAGNPSARVATALLVIYGGNIARLALTS